MSPALPPVGFFSFFLRVLEGGGGPGGEVRLRNEMLMKLVAKKKKKQSLQTFLSGSMTGFYGLFSLVGLHLLFSLKRTTKGKYMNFYASFPLKTTTTTTTKTAGS